MALRTRTPLLGGLARPLAFIPKFVVPARGLTTPPSSSSPTSKPPRPPSPPLSRDSRPASPTTTTPPQTLSQTGRTRSSRIPQAYRDRLDSVAKTTGVPLPTLAVSFLVLHELTAVLPLFLVYYILAFFGAGASIVDWVTQLPTSRRTSQDQSGPQDYGGSSGTGAGAEVAVADQMEEAVNKGEWLRALVLEWTEEGQRRVEKVGRRYGFFGYERQERDSAAPSAGAAGEVRSGPIATLGGPAEKEQSQEQKSAPVLGSEKEDGGEAVIQAIQARAPGMDKVANAIGAYVIVKALLPVRIGLCLAAAAPFARLALLPVQRTVQRLFRR